MKRLKKLSIAFLMLVTICPSAVFADDLSITVNNAPTYNVCVEAGSSEKATW